MLSQYTLNAEIFYEYEKGIHIRHGANCLLLLAILIFNMLCNVLYCDIRGFHIFFLIYSQIILAFIISNYSVTSQNVFELD